MPSSFPPARVYYLLPTVLFATLLLRHKNLLQRDQNLTNWNPTAVRGVERLKKVKFDS